MDPLVKIKVTTANIKSIDFTSPNNKKQDTTTSCKRMQLIEPPTQSELDAFYSTLNLAELKPAILKVTPPYSAQFIPRTCNSSLPTPISHMYKPDSLAMDYLTLVKTCEEVVKTIKVGNRYS